MNHKVFSCGLAVPVQTAAQLMGQKILLRLCLSSPNHGRAVTVHVGGHVGESNSLSTITK